MVLIILLFRWPSSGGWYFELVPTAIGSAENQSTAIYLSRKISVGVLSCKWRLFTNDSGSYGSAWSAGDIIGVAVEWIN